MAGRRLGKMTPGRGGKKSTAVGPTPIPPLAGGPPATMAAMPKRRPRPMPKAPMGGMPAMGGGGGLGGPSPAPGGTGGGVPLSANGV